MAVPKSSDISQTAMQYSCTSIPWNHFEGADVLQTYDQRWAGAIDQPHLGQPHFQPLLSTLVLDVMNQDLEHCHEKHSHPHAISCTRKVSVPPVVFETWLVPDQPTLFISTAAASPHTTVLLLSWRISAGTPPLAFCTALKLSNILLYELFQHRRNRSLLLAGHYSLVLFKQILRGTSYYL